MIILGKGIGVLIGIIGSCYSIWLFRDCWQRSALRRAPITSSASASHHSHFSRTEWCCQFAFASGTVYFSAVVVMAFGGDVLPVLLQSATDSSRPAEQSDVGPSATITDIGATVVRSSGAGSPVVGIDCGNLQISDAQLANLLQESPDLQRLNLSGSSVTADTLKEVKRIPKLQSLGLSIPTLTDSELVYLEGLAGLESLNLARTRITDDGLVHLQGLTGLEWLDLSATGITDKGLAHLKTLTELRQLNLYDTPVTDEGADKFQQALPLCGVYR